MSTLALVVKAPPSPTRLLELLQSFISLNIPTLAPNLHTKIITLGLQDDSFLSTNLIALYSQAPLHISSARAIFIRSPHRNTFILNAIIRALSSNGLHREALRWFCIERRRGLEPDSYTFSCVLKACAFLSDVSLGERLHQLALGYGFDMDLFVSNALVAMYARCGRLESGAKVFDRMPHRDVVSWNSIVSAFALNGFWLEAAERLREMVGSGVEANEATVVAVLAMICDDEGIVRETHGYVLRRGLKFRIMIQNALISAYGKCNLVKEARRVFDGMRTKDQVSWNAMIACYAQNVLFEESAGLLRDMKLAGFDADVVTYSGIVSSFSQNDRSDEAMMVFKELLSIGLKPDTVAIASILPAISDGVCLDYCKQIHGYSFRQGLESDRRVRNALVPAYCKSGLVQCAERVFKAIVNRDVISWSSMVVGYTHNQFPIEAINKYREMVKASIESNPVTITSVLSACAAISRLQLGKEVHSWAMKKSLDGQLFVGSALVDMYAKCGRIQDARRVFDRTTDRNLVTWNSMIGGYAVHGQFEEALQLFYALKEPNDISFVTALSACSHGGLVEDGMKIFNRMKDANVAPREAHYACVVDLLARSGRIEEAIDLVKTMPMKASPDVWGAILGACKMHSDTESGLYSGARILKSGSGNSGYYVLLSNMYAGCGRWEEVEGMREVMKERGVKKGAGCSWVEVNRELHCFVAMDRAQHPEWEGMFRVMSFLNEQMKAIS